MKYSKKVILLYAICVWKMIATSLFFLPMPNDYLQFTIYCGSILSIPSCLAFAFDENLVRLCIVILFITCLVWAASLILSVIGVWYRAARKASVIGWTIATAVDLFMSFWTRAWEIRLGGAVVSLGILVLCVFIFSKDYARKRM